MKKSVLVAMVSGIAMSGYGIVNWNNASGGDFTDSANWTGGKTVEWGGDGDASTQFVKVNGASEINVYLSRDFAIDRLVMNAMSQPYTFDLRGYTLTMMGNVSYASKVNQTHATLRFKNGTINTDNTYSKAAFFLTSDSYCFDSAYIFDNVTVHLTSFGFNTGKDNTLYITNGSTFCAGSMSFASVTNAHVVVSDTSSLRLDNAPTTAGQNPCPVNCRFDIYSGTDNFTAHALNFGLGAGYGNTFSLHGGTHSWPIGVEPTAKGMSNCYEIVDGAVVSMADRFWAGSGSADGATFRISGTGTRVDTPAKASGAMHVGNMSASNTLEVSDGAYLEIGGATLYIGTGNDKDSRAHANTLLLRGGALNITGGSSRDVVVGKAGNYEAFGNKCYITDGGALTNSGAFLLGETALAHHNLAVISNGTLRTQRVIVGRNGHDNTMIIDGANTKIELTNKSDDTFFVGQNPGASNNLAIIRNIPNLTTPGLVKIGFSDTNNTMVVENSTLYVTNSSFALGGAPGENDAKPGHAHLALTNTTLNALRLLVYGQENTVALTNSSIHIVLDTEYAFSFPYSKACNVALTMAGQSPRISMDVATGGLSILSTVTVTLAIPEGGFTQAPFASTVAGAKFILNEGAQVIVEDAGFFKKGGYCPLFEADTIGITDAMKSAILAQFPTGSRWVTNGNVLGIRAPKIVGTRIIVR